MDPENKMQEKMNKAKNSVAVERLARLFDNGEFRELDRFAGNGGDPCEAVTATGLCGGARIYAFSQDISVAGGAMGAAQAAKIRRIYRLAAQTGAPVVGIYDSNGAYVDDALSSMSAYGKLIESASALSGVVPQISIVLGPCLGSAAVLAELADAVIISEKGELSLDPAEFSCGADQAAASGAAAIKTKDDGNAIDAAVRLLSFLPQNNLDEAFLTEYIPAETVTGDVISYAVDGGSFFELSACFGTDVRTGFARSGGAAAGVVSVGGDDNDRLSADAAMKISRFVRLCDAFSLPVITLLDSAGFEDDGAASLRSASMLAHAYSEATCPKITVITGRAYGAAFITFAGRAGNVDAVFAWPDAVISALPPETAVQLLCKDKLTEANRAALEAEYKADAASAFAAAASGAIDDVITPAETAARVISALEMLASKRVSTMDKKHSNIPL